MIEEPEEIDELESESEDELSLSELELSDSEEVESELEESESDEEESDSEEYESDDELSESESDDELSDSDAEESEGIYSEESLEEESDSRLGSEESEDSGIRVERGVAFGWARYERKSAWNAEWIDGGWLLDQIDAPNRLSSSGLQVHFQHIELIPLSLRFPRNKAEEKRIMPNPEPRFRGHSVSLRKPLA